MTKKSTSQFGIRILTIDKFPFELVTKEDVQNTLSNLSEDHLTQELLGSMLRKTLNDLEKEETEHG